jgi:hypothetical protein
MVTMSQKSFVPQAAKSVSQALMSDNQDECGKKGEAKQKSVFLDICESN